jgi:hypothetical protein
MKLFGLRIPGTRDPDAEIAALSERLRTLRESQAHQLNNFHRRLHEKDCCIEAGVREQLTLRKERDDALEALRELQSKAPYQVRDEDGILVSAHMGLKEAENRAFRGDEGLSVWQRQPDGKYREIPRLPCRRAFDHLMD